MRKVMLAAALALLAVPVSAQTAEGFLPKEDWARLPVVPRTAYKVLLLVPTLRNMGKLLRYRFGA